MFVRVQPVSAQRRRARVPIRVGPMIQSAPARSRDPAGLDYNEALDEDVSVERLGEDVSRDKEKVMVPTEWATCPAERGTLSIFS